MIFGRRFGGMMRLTRTIVRRSICLPATPGSVSLPRRETERARHGKDNISARRTPMLMGASMSTRAVPALLLVAMLGGCAAAASGGSQPLLGLPAGLASSARASLHTATLSPGVWVFTAQLYGEDLKIYQRNGLALTYFETLTSGVASPSGTVTAPDGRWYVANGGHSNVLVYRTTKYGPQGPTQVLDDYGERPVNVGLAPSRPLVAVSNGETTSGGAGSVSIYLNHNVEPARILTYGKDALAGMGVAIDHRGNCYWSFNDPKTHSGSIVGIRRLSRKGHGGRLRDSHGRRTRSRPERQRILRRSNNRHLSMRSNREVRALLDGLRNAGERQLRSRLQASLGGR